ncbi:hypothetical protein [Actinoallomurus sp. CA-142502]|uniref:hypothetical protein n=1 Tax=Actinoallomurus sp. CA-142502 TaxID=3239885 RepID=UPI003D8FE1D3
MLLPAGSVAVPVSCGLSGGRASGHPARTRLPIAVVSAVRDVVATGLRRGIGRILPLPLEALSPVSRRA